MWLPDFLKPRVKTTPVSQYSRAVFYPVGAEDAVYRPAYPVVPAMLPMVQLIGAGVYAGNAPSPIFGPQVYALQTAYVAGVGGPLAGQTIHQPMNVPETTNGSQ